MTKYSRNEKIIDNEMGNQQVMLDIDRGKYYGLNSVGKRIWEIVAEPKSIDEIVETLQSEYKIDRERCLSDVREFVEQTVKQGIICTVEIDK